MTLAVTLGVVIAFTWRAFSANRARLMSPYPFTLAALVGVWAVNFFVVGAKSALGTICAERVVIGHS